MVKRGFTLVELLVVLLILGVLVGLAVPRYMQSTKTAKRTTFETNLKEITKALEDYKLQREFQGFGYPPTLESLRDSGIFNKEPINPYTGKSMLSGTSTDSGLLYQSTGPTYKLCVVQRDIEDVNNNGIVDEVLPLTTKSVCIGDMRSNIQLTFIRPSVAYTSNGAQVGVNVPRFEAGKFGQAVMVEEGTTNLLQNPSFETGNFSSWYLFTPYGGATYEVTSEKTWHGSYSVKITADGTARSSVGISQSMVSATAGVTYTFSVKLAGTLGANKVFLVFRWRTADNTLIKDDDNFYISEAMPQTFKTYSATATAPENTAIMEVHVRIVKDAVGVIYVDAAQLEQKPYATSFIDGTRAAETLTIPTAGVLNPQEGTIEFWVKPLVVTNWNNFFYMDTSNGRFMLFFATRGIARFDYGPNSTGPTAPANTIMANNWYHIVLRWSATTGKQALFVNGVKYEQNLPNGVATMFPATVSIVNNYSAYIDDLRISSIARSDAEILAAYQSGQPAPVDANTILKADFDGNLDAQSGIIQ